MNTNYDSLISVIVPVYKVEAYLDECIESIVTQTYKNIEIILVDDGSPDQCPVMCDKWAKKDSRIRVIHKENSGLSDARNKGMEIVSGDFVSFIDSDDVIEPEFIEYLYEALLETDADFSECCFDRFTDHHEREAKSISPVKVISQEEILYKFCNGEQPNNHYVWNKLYKRELIKDELFAYGYLSQDILFCCHIFCKCTKAAHIDNVLYHYRSRDGSSSDAFVKQRLDALEMAYQSIPYLEKNHSAFVKDLKSYYYSLVLGAVNWVLYESPYDKKKGMLENTNAYRKKVHLNKKEWNASSLRQKVRAVSSLPALNIPSLRLRHLLSSLKIIRN